MRKIRIIIQFFTLLTYAYAGAQTYTLEYDLKQGQQYMAEFHTEVNMKQTVMGIDQILEMNMETDFSVEVKEKKTDQSYVFLSEYRKLYINISSAFFNLEVDTKNPDHDEPIISIIQELLNKPASITMDKNGNIKDLRGIGDLIEEMLDEIAVNDDQREQLRMQLENNMGDENIRQYFSQFFCIYPEKPIKKGESWDINYQMIMRGISLDFYGKGTLIEINPGNFLIRIEGEINTFNSTDADEKEEQFFLEGKQVAEITIDRRSGWPLKSIINQDMSGLLLIPSDDPDLSPMEIPMVMKLRMNINSR